MSRIKSRGTKFEQEIFKGLRNRGVYFQPNYSKVIGKPDIALPRKQRAVFLHSDFWHGWQFPRWKNILPNRFWREKLQGNRVRDKKVLRTLRKKGWDVLVVWEHTYRKNKDATIRKIANFLRRR